MTNFSEADLTRMGIVKNGDGTYSKQKSQPQPRELTKNPLPPQITSTLRKITINLFGAPMPKQSVRSFHNKNTGFIGHYQPKEMAAKTKEYQAQIKKQLPAGFKMFENRVHITKMHFIFPPLKAFHKIKGRMDAIRNGEMFYKETKPDLPDNLKKLPLDAMSGIIYKDDAIIVSEDNVKKYYGIGGAIIIEMEGY